jgi:hypothetical protein
MTFSTLARSLFGVLLALQLTACGGSAGVGEAGASSSSSSADQGDDGQESEDDPGSGNAGGPGGDPAGGGAAEVEAEGNPGAPGDVAVFEEAGVRHQVLRDDAATKCAHGVCRLLEPKVVDGDAEEAGGVDQCRIKLQSDIIYVPPAEGGFFQKGATVRANVDCDPSNDEPDGENPDGENYDGGSPDGGSPDGGVVPDDQPQE